MKGRQISVDYSFTAISSRPH